MSRPQTSAISRSSADNLRTPLVRDVADYDRLCTKLIKAVPLSDVSASFAMERIKYETAVPV